MRLTSLLFPPRCLVCYKHLPEKRFSSQPCLACQTALLPLRGEAADFGRVRAPFYYEEDIRRALLRFKFQGKAWYAQYFGQVMAACAAQAWPPGTLDLVTWVPCHFIRRWRRGYDQAELLARRTASCLALPAAGVLIKKRHCQAQSRLRTTEARRQNVKDIFAVRTTHDLAGKRILLVDDICTTHATLEEVRYVLMAAGVSRVHCVTAAAVRFGHLRDGISQGCKNQQKF